MIWDMRDKTCLCCLCNLYGTSDKVKSHIDYTDSRDRSCLSCFISFTCLLHMCICITHVTHVNKSCYVWMRQQRQDFSHWARVYICVCVRVWIVWIWNLIMRVMSVCMYVCMCACMCVCMIWNMNVCAYELAEMWSYLTLTSLYVCTFFFF